MIYQGSAIQPRLVIHLHHTNVHLGRAMRSLDRVYFQNKTSITAVTGMPLFWIQLEQLRTFLPQLFLSAHHLAITSHSFAGRRGCIDNC